MTTTTSTENSGLLDALLPAVTRDIGIQVHALLPGYQVQEKALYIGDDVGIQFPVEAVQIF